MKSPNIEDVKKSCSGLKQRVMEMDKKVDLKAINLRSEIGEVKQLVFDLMG